MKFKLDFVKDVRYWLCYETRLMHSLVQLLAQPGREIRVISSPTPFKVQILKNIKQWNH